MRLLVIDPADDLVGVGSMVFLKLRDGDGRLFNGQEVSLHGLDNVVVVVDSAGDLTMGSSVRSREKGETGKSTEQCIFHSGPIL